MLPNPVPTSPDASAVGGDRPQLKIAARATPDSRSGQPATSVVINDELSAWHGQWRGTLETIKATLADLEQACESGIIAREAEVAGLIDTLVKSATAEATAAADQTRDQAQIEIDRFQEALTELQATVETLQGELDAERDSVKSITAQLEIDGAARAIAETERDEARSECQRQTEAAESQVEKLRSENDTLRDELTLVREQLHAAVAERSKVTATFQVIQQALAQGMSVNMAALAEGAGGSAASIAESRPQEPVREKSSVPEVSIAAPSSDAQDPLAEAHPEVVEDVKRVLEQVEAIYNLDLTSGRSGNELVDSLTGSLRYARDIIVTRWNLDDGEAEALFDHHMATLLDLHAGASFGRHLSIAAYALRKPDASPAQMDPGTTS